MFAVFYFACLLILIKDEHTNCMSLIFQYLHFTVNVLIYWDCLIVIIQYCDISFMLRVHESQHVQCNPPLLFFTFEILTFSFSLLHCCFSQNRYMSIEYGVSKSRYIDEGKGKDWENCLVWVCHGFGHLHYLGEKWK